MNKILLKNFQLFKSIKYISSLSPSLSRVKVDEQHRNYHYNNNNYRNRNDYEFHYRRRFISLTTSICLLYEIQKRYFKVSYAEKLENQEAGSFIDALPTYSLKEVSKHDNRENGVWIIYKSGVYDVTSFIHEHPGGENILLGAGHSVEPFWKIYRQHHTKEVYDLLEKYRIGNLSHEDFEQLNKENEKNDDSSQNSIEIIPERDSTLIVHHEKPFNAETPGDILVKNFYTPNEKFFIRNHLYVPNVDIDDYTLEIDGFGLENPIEFTYEQLKTLFPKYTVTSVVQCGGNRRDDLNKVQQVKGIGWKLGAIGNAKWSGAKLTDVLNYCNAKLDHPSIKHVQFEGMDLDATSAPYGASVPADRALDPNSEFILAYEMNDEPLPADHGFPIRLVAPGIVGARNVKWLNRIVLADHESTSHWQRNDYKSFPSNKNQATPEEFERAFAIQEMPIQSAICLPKSNEKVKIKWKDIDGQMKPCIEASGYAWSGGGRSIIRVDISIDNGKTWHEAQLTQEQPSKSSIHTYSWTLWNVDLPLNNNQLYNGKQLQIICRAFDSSYNTQPSSSDEIWNFRGLLNNSWHRIDVQID